MNVVALESYLQGVVAGEVPYSWPAEALKAQAVAARSYALASLVKGKPFDLYSDARSQVYLGVAGEKPSTTQAVTDTAGRSSSTAGRSRRRTTSRRRGARPRAPPTCSASPCRTSSRGPIRGTSCRRTIAGGRCSSARAPCSRSSGPRRGSSTRLASRLLRAGFARHARDDRRRGAGPRVARPNGARLRSTWITVGVLRLDRPAVGASSSGRRRASAGSAAGSARRARVVARRRRWTPVTVLTPMPWARSRST